MELHERWLAELRSERIKNKTAFAEGKITDEEYMNSIDKEINLSTMTIQEVYALRSQAKKENNKPLLDKIYLFINSRSGAFADTMGELLVKRQQFKEDLAWGKISPEEYKKLLDEIHAANNCPIRNNFNQRYGSMGHERQFIEAGKLIHGDEKILVLIPHESTENQNVNNIHQRRLQDVLLHATFQEDPNSSDLKNPSYDRMNCTFEELRETGGIIEQAAREYDIVLEKINQTWFVRKARGFDVQDGKILKFPEVTLNDLLTNSPKDIWVYIDHRLGFTNECENLYHAFSLHMAERHQRDINIHLVSGRPSSEWYNGKEKDIVLMASPEGFFVEQTYNTPYEQNVIPIAELIGFDLTGAPLSSIVRAHAQDVDIENAYPKPGERLDPNDVALFYTHPVKALMPYEKPGQAYSLSSIQEADLTTLKGMGDPKTGLTLSKEDQDKHAEEMVAAIRSRKE